MSIKTSEASLKYIKGSPYKLNVVADLIRGMSATEADNQLTFCDKRVSGIVQKLLRSCIANAINNHGLAAESLVIHRVDVGKAFVLKRFLPCGRGRSSRIEKRYSRLKIILINKNVANKK